MNSENQQLSFVTTADGSKTIFNAAVGENYHSRHGALQESRHVFLETGLVHFLEISNAKKISVLEIGFGTGLNFLLSADYCVDNQVQINYTGIDAYPLTAGMIAETGYEEYVQTDLWNDYTTKYQQSFNAPAELGPVCHLKLLHSPFADYRSDNRFDVIYYDAFAVAYQPEMWTEKAILHAASFLNPGGIFVTYAITGNLKRLFKNLGFKVEKAPGAAGKREMLRASKPL